MADYKLTHKAVDDLSEIWNYTYEVWSEQQADKYYKELIAFCQEIAKNRQLGKTYNGISEQLLGIPANSHIIFYRIIDDHFIEITRILHKSMDLKNRIKE